MKPRFLGIGLFLHSLLLAQACVTTPPPRPSAAESTPSTEEVIFTPRSTPALSYGEERSFRLYGFEARVLAAIRRLSVELDKGEITTDHAAQAMARDICLGLLPSGPPPSGLVNFAMETYGIVEPPPHLLVATLPFAALDQVLTELESRLRDVLSEGQYNRVGVAMAVPLLGGERQRLVVALMERRVTLEPLPRRLALRQTVPVQVTARTGLRNLKLVVAAPDGRITTHALELEPGSLTCTFQGIYQVEVTGDGPFGVEVLANFPVYCDRPPPMSVRYRPSQNTDRTEGEIEQELFDRTNALRQGAGLPALQLDLALTEAARSHCQEMRDLGFVGHISPKSGSPAERLKRAGIVHLLARENVARGYGAQEIMDGLMASPAHRENILSSDVTRMGVGVALDRRTDPPVLFCTQEFIKPGTPVAVVNGESQAMTEVARLRALSGARPLQLDPKLQVLARQAAILCAKGSQTEADQFLDQGLDRQGETFQRVDSLQARVQALEGLTDAKELRDPRYTHIGLGVAHAAADIVIFILLGVAR